MIKLPFRNSIKKNKNFTLDTNKQYQNNIDFKPN